MVMTRGLICMSGGGVCGVVVTTEATTQSTTLMTDSVDECPNTLKTTHSADRASPFVDGVFPSTGWNITTYKEKRMLEHYQRLGVTILSQSGD
jgi:hypothetical protein